MNALRHEVAAYVAATHSRSTRSRTAALVVGALALVSVAAPASAAPAQQSALVITTAVHSAYTTGHITVDTRGGSGTGAVRFTATGAGCTINAVTGVLRDATAGTCVVKATKAASGHFGSTSSASVRFTFSVEVFVENATNQFPDRAALVTSDWAATGFTGLGPVDDSVNGRSWFINHWYSPTDRWLYCYVTPGAQVTMTWHITGSQGQPLTQTAVTLETQFAPGTNNGKGGKDATFTATGLSAGNITGVTDANGNVSFVLLNTNSNVPSPPYGFSMTSTATTITAGVNVSQLAAETIESGSTYPWTRMALQIGSDIFTSPNTQVGNNPTTDEATDLVDVIVMSH
jgi:hypothetical protein